jgi:hypothetical protein
MKFAKLFPRSIRPRVNPRGVAAVQLKVLVRVQGTKHFDNTGFVSPLCSRYGINGRVILQPVPNLAWKQGPSPSSSMRTSVRLRPTWTMVTNASMRSCRDFLQPGVSCGVSTWSAPVAIKITCNRAYTRVWLTSGLPAARNGNGKCGRSYPSVVVRAMNLVHGSHYPIPHIATPVCQIHAQHLQRPIRCQLRMYGSGEHFLHAGADHTFQTNTGWSHEQTNITAIAPRFRRLAP